MTRVLIINGHPDPSPERFVHGALDSYAEGAGVHHEVKRIAVGALDFPVIRSRAQWQDEPVPADIEEAQNMLRWAEHLVVAYPLWLGDMPALLKAFFEQVLRNGFAFDDASGKSASWPKARLGGKSARVIVTMGMPAPVYSLYFRAHSLKSLERNILGFVGFGPVRHSIIGMVDGDAGHREKWLARLRRLGEKGR